MIDFRGNPGRSWWSMGGLLWVAGWLAVSVLVPAGLNGQTDEPVWAGTAGSGNLTAETDFEFTPVGKLPEWVSSFDEDGSVESSVVLVASVEVRHQLDAERLMWEEAEVRVRDYLNRRIADGAGDILQLDRDQISEHLVTREPHLHLYRTPNPLFEGGNGETEHLEWYRCFARLSMDGSFDRWATDRYEERLVRSRLLQTGLLLFSGLALLGVAWSFLQMNHRTRGFYTGRLQTISLLAVLVVIALALALSNLFRWL